MSGLRGWVDEIQAWNPPPAAHERDSRLQHDIRRLHLITQAKNQGATWATIGAALGGISGPQAKRDARKLAARVKRHTTAKVTP